jgi:hypothetical protein
MPSSHAAISIGTITLFVAHSMFRSAPVQIAVIMQLGTTTGHMPAPVGWTSQWLYTMKHISANLLKGVPFDEPSQEEVIMLFGAWVILLLPVPICRIVLSDHTPGQVLIGGAVGMFAAILWSFAKSLVERRSQSYLGREWRIGRWRLMTHNMALPCYRALISIESRHIELEAMRENGNMVGYREAQEALLRQLKWYEFETLRRCTAHSLTKAQEDEYERYLKFRWCLVQEFIFKISPDSEADSKFLARSRKIIRDADDKEKVFSLLKSYWTFLDFNTLTKAEAEMWRTVGVLDF